VQLLPDLTARIEREGVFGAVQLSGVLTTLSIRNNNYKINNVVGFGGSLSGTVDFTTEHKLLYQITYGKSISHFINTFSGTGMDAIFNSATDQIEPIWSFGGFLAYGFDWTTKISSTISGGYANLSSNSSQSNDMYRESMSAFFDVFWNIIDGARLGVEYGYAHRWNTDRRNDGASRISALFYYDF
jgi:hypothetical protein